MFLFVALLLIGGGYFMIHVQGGADRGRVAVATVHQRTSSAGEAVDQCRQTSVAMLDVAYVELRGAFLVGRLPDQVAVETKDRKAVATGGEFGESTQGLQQTRDHGHLGFRILPERGENGLADALIAGLPYQKTRVVVTIQEYAAREVMVDNPGERQTERIDTADCGTWIVDPW